MDPRKNEENKERAAIDEFVEKTMRILSFMPEPMFNRFMKLVKLERSLVNVTTIITLPKEERDGFRRYAIRKCLGLEDDEE